MSPASDEELLVRQSALQVEAGEVLAGLDLAALVADLGPLLVTGSFVSGLMCWREVDVMVLAGSDFSPRDVLGLLTRIVAQAGVGVPAILSSTLPIMLLSYTQLLE